MAEWKELMELTIYAKSKKLNPYIIFVGLHTYKYELQKKPRERATELAQEAWQSLKSDGEKFAAVNEICQWASDKVLRMRSHANKSMCLDSMMLCK